MRKPSEAKSRFVYFWLFPSSAVSNKKVRRSLYVLVAVTNWYRFMKAFVQAEEKARRRAELDAIKARVIRNNDELHMMYVDLAIRNNRIIEGEADAAWCREHGIEL